MIMYRIRGIHDANISICIKFYPFLITIQSTQVAEELGTFDKYPTHTTEQVFIEFPRTLLYVALTRLCVQIDWKETLYKIKTICGMENEKYKISTCETKAWRITFVYNII